jgi:calcium-dependent protein kinase
MLLQDVIHRDLKPENILLMNESMEIDSIWVKLCDFGLARFFSSDDRQMTSKIGTPAFMPPEMMTDSGVYDSSVDVYSFGIMLWSLWGRQVRYVVECR